MKKILVMMLVVSLLFTLTNISAFAAKGGNAGGSSRANDSGKSKSAALYNTTEKKSVVDNQIEKKDKGTVDSTVIDAANSKSVKGNLTREQRKQAIKEIVAQKRAKNDHATPVIVSGKDVKFDVPPVIKYGRTLIPVRAITNALGGDVQWNSETKTVTITKGEVTITIVLGSNIITVNGQETTIDVPVQLVSNRTMVPIRFIAQAFKQQVDWDEDTGAVVIEEGTSTISPEPSPQPTEESSTDTTVPVESDTIVTPIPTEPDISEIPVVADPVVIESPIADEPATTETPVVDETAPSPTPELSL